MPSSLRVRTDIPFGNACAIRIDGSTVSFQADPHGGPASLWFCLRIEADGPPPAPQFRLILRNFNNLLGGRNPQDCRPVIRYDGDDWQRLPGAKPIEHEDGRRDAAWAIDAPRTFADVAFCYPYGPDDLHRLVAETNGVYECDDIGISQAGRSIERLSNAHGSATDATRPGIYLIARQHSGETSGSWVLDGLLRELAKAGSAGPLVWSVPLTNIDGVLGGDYGKDNFPYDLNRAWGIPPMRHETLVLQQDLHRWRKRCRPVLALDLHAPGAVEKDGVYHFAPDPDQGQGYAAEVDVWSERLRRSLADYAAPANFGRVARYRSRWETPTFAQFCRDHIRCPAMSMEFPYSMIHQIVLTREIYQDIGARIAKGILEGIKQKD